MKSIWSLFSSDKKESLVDILKRYSEDEVRKAIPKAFPRAHYSLNPPKGRKHVSAETGGER